MSKSNAMIELNQVTKTYPDSAGNVTALEDINLTVQSGKICGVIGKSGAGKSTLMRCVNLLERPDAGTIKIAGHDLTAMSELELRHARQHIGMIFQHFNLLSSRTVFDNIALPLELAGNSSAKIVASILPLLELTGLADKKDSYPAQLSGGQKQRVAIARALACKPKVLLCDEATSALDPHTTKSILSLLKDINDNLGLTILLITHEMDVIKEIADQVVILEQGRIAEQASLIDFFTAPKTDIAKNFIRASLKQELPAILQQQIHLQSNATANPVLRILFQGSAATQPLISNLIQHIGIEINILQASMEFIKQHTLGIMVVEIIGNQNKLQHGVDFLQAHGLTVEVIGYVNSTRH